MLELLTNDIALPENVQEVMQRAVETALKRHDREGIVSIAIVDNEEIRELNRDFRDKDVPTDVLSFPADEGVDLPAVPDRFIGDIAISYERACEQAEAYGHPIIREMAFLTIHGCLHLLGYDHMNEEDQAVMFDMQNQLLKELNITR